MTQTSKVRWLGLILISFAPVAAGDVLLTTNGERFIGTIVEQTTNLVVFESELAGRVALPPDQVRELQRTSLAATNPPASTTLTNLSWRPPGVGHDGSDWIQLKSGEWLRGELKYIQDKKVEFDSDELEDQTLDLKDVTQIYPAQPMYAKFEDQEPVYGDIIVSNNVVTVIGPEQVSAPRDLLTGITPGGGKRGLRNWSGKASVGLTLQSGNNIQTTLTASAELARRTPSTRLLLDYLANYSQVNDVQSANNQRVNLTYDVRLDRHWFVRPVQFEYYRDSLANIDYRLTGGVGVGCDIFDRDGLDWTLAAGPSYQYTRFQTVQAGESTTASTPAAVLQSNFDVDITKRLTFIQTFQATFVNQSAGQYTHHFVNTLEFEIKRHLNLDVSFVWDYLQRPQTRSDGSVPEKSDYYLTVGFGARF